MDVKCLPYAWYVVNVSGAPLAQDLFLSKYSDFYYHQASSHLSSVISTKEVPSHKHSSVLRQNVEQADLCCVFLERALELNYYFNSKVGSEKYLPS